MATPTLTTATSSTSATAATNATPSTATAQASGPDYGNYATVDLGGTPTNVAISSDGDRSFVVVDGTRVAIVDTGNSPPNVSESVTVGRAPDSIAANSSGTRAYVTNSGDNTVSIIDKGLARTSTTKVTTVTVGSNPTGIAVSSSGTRAYVANTGSNTVSIIDADISTLALSTTKPPKVITVTVGPAPTSIAVNAAGTVAYVTNSSGNTVTIIKYSGTGTPKVIDVPVGSGPRSVKASENGSKAIVYSDGGIVSIIDSSGANPTVTEVPGTHYSYGAGPGYPNGSNGFVAISADGKKAFVTEHDAQQVAVIDTTQPSQEPTYSNLGDYPHSIISLRTGTYAFTVAHNALYVVDSATAQAYTVAIPADNDSSIYQRVAINSNGTRIIAVDNSGHLTAFYYSNTDGNSSNPIDQSIHDWLASVGTLVDDINFGLKKLHALNGLREYHGLGALSPLLSVVTILDDLGHGRAGEAAYDTVQTFAGALEWTKFPPLVGVGLLLDTGSYALHDVLNNPPGDPNDVLRYTLDHPFGAISGATNGVVGLVANTASHFVPKVIVDAVVDPIMNRNNHIADNLDNFAHDVEHGVAHGVDNVLHGKWPWE